MRSLLFCLAIITLAAPVNAAPSDSRASYSDIIPRDWTMAPPRAGSAERRFESPRRDAWLVLYAEPAGEPVSIHLDRLKAIGGGQVTYERQGRGWIVVSGFKGDRIFYRKAVLACGGRAWHYLEFEYPAAQKRGFDRFVTLASTALGAYSQSGCRS